MATTLSLSSLSKPITHLVSWRQITVGRSWLSHFITCVLEEKESSTDRAAMNLAVPSPGAPNDAENSSSNESNLGVVGEVGKNSFVTSHVGLVEKNPPANAADLRDTGSIPGWGRSLGGGHGSPLQYSSWRIPWREEPGGLWSIGSHRVGRDWSDLAHIALPGKQEHSRLMPLKSVCLNPGEFDEEFYSNGSKAEMLIRIRVYEGPALL